MVFDDGVEKLPSEIRCQQRGGLCLSKQNVSNLTSSLDRRDQLLRIDKQGITFIIATTDAGKGHLLAHGAGLIDVQNHSMLH